MQQPSSAYTQATKFMARLWDEKWTANCSGYLEEVISHPLGPSMICTCAFEVYFMTEATNITLFSAGAKCGCLRSSQYQDRVVH